MTSAASPEATILACQKIRALLERKRDEFCREIGDYPPPRPACDVDFNRLLEERALVFQELARLDDLLSANLTREQLAEQLREFISTSPAIDEAARPIL